MPAARALLLAVAGSSGEEREGPAAGSRPPSLPSLKKLGAEGAWVRLPCHLSRFPQQQDSVTAFLLEASWARMEVAQKDFGAVASAVGTGKYRQRRPGLGGRDAPRPEGWPGPALLRCRRVPTGRAVSLLRRVGPTVGPTLMKQTDEGLRGDKHCNVEQQETRAESPSSDSTEVTASSRSRNPCFGGSCHGFPKRSATKASTCLMLFSGQLRFSVK